MQSLDEIELGHYSAIPIEEMIPRIDELYRSSKPNSRDRGRAAFLLGAHFENRDYPRARAHYLEAHEIATTLNDPRLLSDTLHSDAVEAFKRGDVAAVQKLEEEALGLACELGHQYRIAFCHYVLGVVALLYGANEEGVEHLNIALREAREHGFLKLQSRLYSKLTELYLISKNFLKAKECASAMEILMADYPNPDELREAQIRHATIDLELGEFGHVEDLVQQIAASLGENDASHNCVTLTLIGKVHTARKEWMEAETRLNAALSLATYPGAERVRSNVHVHLCQLYLDTNRYDVALMHSLSALEDAQTSKDVYSQKEALRVLQESYRATNNFELAYKYLEEYNTLVSESDNALLRNRLEYHDMKSELEIERANASEQRKQSELLKIEHEHQERKLLEQIRHLLAQAAQLDKFRDELKSLIRNAPAGDAVARELRFKLNTLPTTVMNFDEFSSTFDAVHPGFTKSLFRDYPALTPTEVKLCTVLRLNLKSEDIARLFCLSERTVETHRLNIRRKLGLGRETSLGNFLNAL